MTITPPPNPLQRLVRRFGSTRAGAWYFSKVGHHLDLAFSLLFGDRVILSSILTGFPMIMLTTLGAKSMQPRTVPVVGIPDGGNILLVASNWGQKRHPGWYYNLRAHPEATLTMGGVRRAFIAHEAVGAERESSWPRALDLNPGYAAYQERTGGRKIPLLILTSK